MHVLLILLVRWTNSGVVITACCLPHGSKLLLLLFCCHIAVSFCCCRSAVEICRDGSSYMLLTPSFSELATLTADCGMTRFGWGTSRACVQLRRASC